jgi:hypothetical protein
MKPWMRFFNATPMPIYAPLQAICYQVRAQLACQSSTIHSVNTMVFITHFWKNVKLERMHVAGWALGVWWLMASAAWAQNATVDLVELRAERRDAALYLNVQLKLELGAAIEDALMKGLAVHFVAEAELMRDRWYWTDRKVGAAARYYRLAFQPLTRRWRLNVSQEPISGAGLAVSISQNFETLPEALDVIRRQSGWKVADVVDADAEVRQYVSYRFRLDMSQLPRPFQIAAGNQSDWALMVSRQLRLNNDSGR